jgi:hypothetical protein
MRASMTSTMTGRLQTRPWHVSGWDWGSSDADSRISHTQLEEEVDMSLRLQLLLKGHMTLLNY